MMCRSLVGVVRPFVAAVLAVASTATAGQADELDKVLADNARGVLNHLSDAKVGTVGVLKFEVTVGDVTHRNLGRMNDSMATRLENALVVVSDPDAPAVRITRGASKAAVAADPAATDRTAEGRAALFNHKYPLVWGEPAKVDAFLVGRVAFTPDLKSATVSLWTFTAAAPAVLTPVPLSKPTVPVSRQILADIDQSFGVRTRGGKVPELNTRADVDKAATADTAVAWATVDELIDLQVYYDGKRVNRQANGDLPPPAAGQKVHFTAKVNGPDRLGVVLLVNGINTIDKETNREADRFTRWVMEPGRGNEYLIRGFYTGGKREDFEAAPPAVAARKLSELASPSRLGELEVLVYREVKAGFGERVNLDRFRTPFREFDGTAPSLKEAQKQIDLLQAEQMVKRSLIVPGAESEHKLETTEFEGVLVARVVLRYAPAAK
jgi:hypothetical protein